MKKLLLVPLIAVAFTACWKHGHHGNHDKRIDWVAGKIESKLDLTDAQKPAFQALVTKVKTEAKARQQKGEAALRELKTEVEKPQLDVDRIAALAKARNADRLDQQTIDQFIDEAAAFLKQLTPDQQKKAAELVKDRLDWLD